MKLYKKIVYVNENMNINKYEDFSEWFSTVLAEANITDLRYPVKGMPVYRGHGFRMLDIMFRNLEEILDSYGHEKVLFPVAISKSIFTRESEHIKGFEGEVFWITHGGETQLDDPLLLRPTSETPMYYMFNLWINSHGDLPLKIYQTTTVYRYETKATRPLIRGREIYWNEGHSAHVDFEDAYQHVRDMIGAYSQFFDRMGLPYKIVRRPEHDKFPGAAFTYAFDTIMPSGRTLQIGTVHHLGENFAKAYDIQYTDEEGNRKYVSQASYGISMRALAAVMGIHGDDKGLMLPFDVAPVQVVFIPIYVKNSKEKIDEELKGIFEDFKSRFRCVYDDSNKRPGEKYYKWELLGVPVRIEMGPRDLKNGAVTVVNRLGAKVQVKIEDLDMTIYEIIHEYNEMLRLRAWARFNENIHEIENYEELTKWASEPKGIVVGGWCGDIQCANKMKDELKLDILGFEMGEENVPHKCSICGKDGKRVIIGKPY